jgi:Flp pilus assembly pilin Flp
MFERFSLMIGRALTFDLESLRREDGQTVVEYGLVLAFVAIALVTILGVLSGGINTFITAVNNQIKTLPGF